MRYNNRILPLLTPFLIWLLFQIFFVSPNLIYVILVLTNLLIFFTCQQFSRASNFDKSWWNYLILPSLISSSLIAFSVLLYSKLLIQLFYALNALLLYFYFRNIYYYLLRPQAYQSHAVENMSALINFFSYFLIAATVYGLQSFLNVSIWLLTLAILFISALAVYQVIWANSIKFNKAFIYIPLSCLIMVELFWSISFFPVSHYIAGLSLAICYYMLIGLVRHHLLNKLNREKIKFYLGFGLASLFVILFTANWL
jgi:hypothetical protein